MKRNKIHYISDQNNQKDRKASIKNIVFHAAGYATAIYLNNMARNLPPVFFQIKFEDIHKGLEEESFLTRPADGDCVVKIEGGRLIQSFSALPDATDDYLNAFEADIVNILIGPLAEAKYIYESDDEFFSELLVNIPALNNYDGRIDLALVKEYLQSLYSSEQEQDEKLHQFFIAAFDFIENYSNWQVICQLADYIVESNKSIITYEEIISMLESILEEPLVHTG